MPPLVINYTNITSHQNDIILKTKLSQCNHTTQYQWLSGATKAEREKCTRHQSKCTTSDPNETSWDRTTITREKSVRGCDFLSDSGMKYFSLFDTFEDNNDDDNVNNMNPYYQSEFEMRQILEQSAADLGDIVKVVDDAYGITEALRSGNAPVIPERVSALHYTTHTMYNETFSDIEWYTLRDSCQCLMYWSRACDSFYWQYIALYMGMIALIDDACIPPWDVESGIYLYHGLSLKNIVDLICKFGPEGTHSWYPYLWNTMMKGLWIQYLEKTGAEIAKVTPQASRSDIMKHCQSKGMIMYTIMTRAINRQVPGAPVAALIARGVAREDVCDCMIHDAAIAHGIMLDLSKDTRKMIHNDVTNTLTEKHGSAEADSRRLVLRQTLRSSTDIGN